MYMLSYKGSKGSRTFQTHQTISECQKDADSHAAENSRLRGEYLIQKVEEFENGLVRIDYAEKFLKGIKHGKTVEWNT